MALSNEFGTAYQSSIAAAFFLLDATTTRDIVFSCVIMLIGVMQICRQQNVRSRDLFKLLNGSSVLLFKWITNK